MKPLRLSGRKTVDRLKRKGRRWKGKHMQITIMMGLPANITRAGVYVGTAASVKLHKSAVKRNTMRRRCREALREYMRTATDLPNCQLLITPRSSSLSTDFAELLEDAENVFIHLKQYGNYNA